jgi:bifunctional DNA-binding transcriptional regulator/antitoxin component of YhaV-PrlF toxin-antitoxin module
MSGTYPITMGDRGRLVVPLEVRERHGLHAGSPLLLVETAHGLVVATREQAKRLVRDDLRGASLVDELIIERRREAAEDDR